MRPSAPTNTERPKPHSEDNQGRQHNPLDNEHCPMCKRAHKLRECPVFASKPIQERRDFVNINKRCWICLELHFARNCTTPDQVCPMRNCTAKHHIVLHQETPGPDKSVESVDMNQRAKVYLRILPV